MNKKLIYVITAIFIIIIILAIIINIINKNKSVKDAIHKNQVEYQDEGGTKEEDENQINNLNMEMQGLTEEMKAKIGDVKAFNTNIKKYIYENGLIQAKTANLKNYEQTDKELRFRFELDDSEQTRVIVIVNLEQNNYEILSY